MIDETILFKKTNEALLLIARVLRRSGLDFNVSLFGGLFRGRILAWVEEMLVRISRSITERRNGS